jgi:outer membrane protein OmpA-like peptidoglycan-associated protein
MTVELDGYTDTWGSYKSNDRVAELRATNLKNILLLNKIEEKRIETNWHGEMIPFGGCLLQYPCPVSEENKIEGLKFG